MKRILILPIVAAALLAANAQTARQDIVADPHLSASNYLAYRGPLRQLTPAPKGYQPFYLSHYGRHGSRYLIGEKDYDYPVSVLTKAHDDGKLTALGEDALRRVKLMREESRGRTEELTPLGALQHQQIAERMYRRFPEVFAGPTDINARSTIVIRCILSMENELQQLLRLNPQLNIFHDASRHDMFYMNLSDKQLEEQKMPRRARVAYDDYCQPLKCYDALMQRLFTDQQYVRYEVDAERLSNNLFKLAGNLQSSPLAEQMTLYDLFTPQELYQDWLQTNAWWYINFGPSPLNGGTQPFSQRNLLRNIIETADTCITKQHPGATLRFGHETMVLPLTCLLGLNGYDRQMPLDSLDACGWHNYDIFPMAANVQFVFYRPVAKRNAKKQTQPADGEVLLKVLLNEDEATLPLPSDLAPYYRWSDFRRYYLQKLESYSGR